MEIGHDKQLACVRVCVRELTCVYSSPQAHTSRSWAMYLCLFSATFGRAALEEQLHQQMTFISLNSFLLSHSLYPFPALYPQAPPKAKYTLILCILYT